MPEGQLEQGHLLNERYRILRVIGKGGMGTVYQAEHERLKSVVAVKEITAAPDSNTAQQAAMAQYEQEAQILVRLNHPNLPKVMDAFVDGDRFYLVMDYVEGATLDKCLRLRHGKPLDPVTTVNLALEISDVLAYLHSQKPSIIFRDLKPANVMVQPDKHIKLIDFGIARRFQPGASQDTSYLGSVGYSPPEQFGQHQTDKRSDIYALGATMHQMLTLRDPSVSPFKFAPVDQVVRGVPTSLAKLVAYCLALDPEQRPPDVSVVAAELRSILDLMNGVAVPTEQPRGERESNVAARMASVGAPGTSGAPSAPKILSGNVPSYRRSNLFHARLRWTSLALGMIVIFGATEISVNNGARPVKPKKHPVRKSLTHASTNSTHHYTGSYSYTGSGSGDSSNSSNDGGGSDAGETTQQSAASESTGSGGAKSARCTAEVLGPSLDGASIRIHVTGEITGGKDTTGLVVAYIYHHNRSPLSARDTKGSNAAPSGQLIAEYSFPIDADAKSIDGLIDVPVDQFTSTKNLLFKCIIYADSQRAGQTEFMPFPADIPASSGS